MKPTGTINCSEPTTDALLVALKENVFGKTDMRPVINPKTPTNINVSFILYGILDVVSLFNITGNQTCGSWDKRVSHIRKKNQSRGKHLKRQGDQKYKQTLLGWLAGTKWAPYLYSSDRKSKGSVPLWRQGWVRLCIFKKWTGPSIEPWGVPKI